VSHASSFRLSDSETECPADHLLEREQKIRELCAQVRMCKYEAQRIFLLAHLKLLIHDYIENPPDKVLAFPSVVDANSKVKKAS
jgi:hypothetical protein